MKPFIWIGEELRKWAMTHPEYTRDQILSLAACMADANSLKKKDRGAFLAQLDADLNDFRSMRS